MSLSSLGYAYTLDCCNRLKVQHLGLDAAREASSKKRNEVKFEPKGKEKVKGPKEGREDPNNEEHSGGGTWAGGVSHLCGVNPILLAHHWSAPRREGVTPQVLAVAAATSASTKATKSSR